MSPIRIAHVVEATVGGVARHLIDLVTHLDPQEFACSLYCSFQRPDSWTAALRSLAAPDRPLRELGMARVINPSVVRQLTGWLQRDAVDIVHLHSAKAGYLGRQATIDLDLPVLYTPHAFPFQRTTDWRRPLYRAIERKLARQTTKIICVSQGEYDEATAAGLPEEKLVVIPNGIDPEQWPVPTPAQRREARTQWRIAPDDLVIGAMGRLVPQKGFDLLLVAMEELLPDFPNARLMIWGDGPQRAQLQRLARQLRIRRVDFLGATDDPWQAYAIMDIFCAPSRWEAGPYAVLEAMACGTPVVATEVPGHTDYIEHEETGILVEPDLPGPLDGALRILLVDEDSRNALRAAACQHVRTTFTVAQMARETAALYRTLTGR